MGREVRRVPLDFSWPLKKTWEGFLNPHYRKCPADCDGGYSPAYRDLQQAITDLMWHKHDDPLVRKVTGYLAGRAPRAPFWHDSVDMWRACKKLGELAGLPENWDTCATCHGDGIDPAIKEAYEAWAPTPPPTGDGWQMWETTSEGSPISPVFATPEELARWLAKTGASTFGDQTTTYDRWLAMIREGWAPSAVVNDGVLTSGVDAVGEVGG